MNSLNRKTHFYFLVEMISALALLMILAAAFFASLRALQKMDRDFSSENRGLMIIDNTLERLKCKKHYTADEVKNIFIDEFGKSGVAISAKMKNSCEIKGKIIALTLLKANSKPLIEVKIQCY